MPEIQQAASLKVSKVNINKRLFYCCVTISYVAKWLLQALASSKMLNI